jgi:hypothetical protein
VAEVWCAMCAEMYACTSRCDWSVISIDSVDVTHPLQLGVRHTAGITRREEGRRTCTLNNHSS